MTIQLSPELEALVQEDISSGPYRDLADFVEKAVVNLHDQERWIAEHREDIRASLEQAWQEAKRGELMPAEEVKREMEQMKAEWGLKNPAA